MGIKELIPRLAAAIALDAGANVFTDCEGSRSAVDSSCWLHRFATRYPVQLEYKKYDRLRQDFLQLAKRLCAEGHDLIFVFDGKYMPAKGGTAESRANARLKSRQQAMAARTDQDSAAFIKFLRKAVSCDSRMVAEVVDELRANGFAVLVAPYEADHQLAWLARNGIVDHVLTLDTDLVALGCPSVYLKIDYGTGQAVHVTTDSMERAATGAEELSLLWFYAKYGTVALVRYGQLAGCDYVNCAGVGPKKALDIMAAVHQAKARFDTDADFINAVQDMRTQPAGFDAQFVAAGKCFEHAIVYDIRTEKQTTLDGTDFTADYLGTAIPDAQACRRVALGFVPTTWQVGLRVYRTDAADPTDGANTDSARGVVQAVDGVQDQVEDGTVSVYFRGDVDTTVGVPVDGLRLDLCPVLNSRRNFSREPLGLSFDSVPGAVLPPRNTWINGSPSGADFLLFFKTRNREAPRDKHVANLRAMAASLLDIEAQTLSKGGRINLRDTSGSSAFQHFASKLRVNLPLLRGTNVYQPPDPNSAQWIKGALHPPPPLRPAPPSRANPSCSGGAAFAFFDTHSLPQVRCGN